jgi:hypothetical protein
MIMTTINPNTVTIADIIAALNDVDIPADQKFAFIQKAADPEQIGKVAVALNYYFADKVDEYVDDADAALVAAERAQKEAKEKARKEQEAKDRMTRIMNAAAANLRFRGVEMFKDAELNPDYQTALNEEIGKLKKGDRMYVTSDGEYFVPDSSRSNLSPKQLEAIDKAGIEAVKSNETIDLEDTRPMTNGPHEVTISYYAEKPGRNGKDNYAVINVVEINTGKHCWLPSWTLAHPRAVDPRDAWRTRYFALKTIALNNRNLGEHMKEEDMVNMLRKTPFTIFTYQKADGNLAVYLDEEQYRKFIERQAQAEIRHAEAEKRDNELRAMGLNPDDVEADESIEQKSYKF